MNPWGLKHVEDIKKKIKNKNISLEKMYFVGLYHVHYTTQSIRHYHNIILKYGGKN